jgi:virulence factor Mce-like protein
MDQGSDRRGKKGSEMTTVFWTPERKVGVTVTAMAALFVFITFAIKGYKPLGEKYILNATFSSVGLLTPGSPVRMRGVQVGQVDRVFLEDTGEGVKVRMKIDRKRNIMRGTTALIHTSGLMGEQYVELSPPLTPEATPEFLIAGDVVKGRDKYDTEEVFQDVRAILKESHDFIANATLRQSFANTLFNLESISSNLNNLMGGKEQGEKILANVQQTAEKANRSMDGILDLQQQLRDVIGENRADIRATVVAAREAMVGLSDEAIMLASDFHDIRNSLVDFTARLDGMVERNETDIDDTVASLKQTAEKVSKFSESMLKMLAALENGEGALGALLTDKEVEESIRRSLDSLEGVTGQAKNVVGDASKTLHRINNLTEGFGFEYDMSYFEERDRYQYDDNNLRNDLALVWRGGPHKLRTGANLSGDHAEFELTYGYLYRQLRLMGGVLESDAMVGLEWTPHERLLLGARGARLTGEDERADVYGMLRFNEYLALRFGVEDVFDENFGFIGLRLEY